MIEVKHLTKKYGEHLAVSDLSFTIDEGHIYGFLGPNGAGKSTTMNIMTGCLAPTQGEVTIGGHDIFEEPKEAKKLLGYLPEMPPLYMDQTPREYLDFVAMAKGITGKSARLAAIEKVISETRIEEVADRLIKKLSKGYRQRVGIAQALLGDPQVIILDEPTVGLDPAQIIEIRDLIKELGKSHTVILSSHILSEVQAICDEVIIINKGKLIAYDKTENLGKKAHGGSALELCVECAAQTVTDALSAIELIKSIEVKQATPDSCKLLIATDEEDTKVLSKEIFKACVDADITVIQLSPVKASLEDIFIELTEADPADTASETPAGEAPYEPENEFDFDFEPDETQDFECAGEEAFDDTEGADDADNADNAEEAEK